MKRAFEHVALRPLRHGAVAVQVALGQQGLFMWTFTFAEVLDVKDTRKLATVGRLRGVGLDAGRNPTWSIKAKCAFPLRVELNSHQTTVSE